MFWKRVTIAVSLALLGAGPEIVAAQAAEAPATPRPPLAAAGHWSPPPPSRISDEARRRIWERIRRHRQLLRTRGLATPQRGVAHPLFAWPLRAAANLADNGYHAIDAFVDNNPAFPGFLSDHECGTRTYDLDNGYNHRGSDFFSWPFAWWKLDQDAVEVVAAAAGTIIDRGAGNFDRRCVCETDDPNYVIVEHADGSTVWYFHMKNGSVTPKSVGQTVAVGEYLGVVGSSGCSGAPHLHFEVYDSGDDLVDPYDGTCNAFNSGDGWWLDQRPYYDSALNALSTHEAIPAFPSCPDTTDQPFYRNAFDPGETAYFAVFYRDSQIGHETQLAIRRPDGSLFASWTHTDTGPYFPASWWIWSMALPGAGPEGTWTFEATYQAATFSHRFAIGAEIFADGFESGDTTAW